MAKDSENKKLEIIKLYYEDHLTQKEIAEKLSITQGYVSQVIKEDERYISHKEEKHKKSLEKKANYDKEYYKTYKRPKKDNDSYAQLQAQLDKDSLELSYNSWYISDLAFAKWNRQMFKYDKKSSDLVLKRNIVVSCDVPKRVSNVVNASCIRSKEIHA